MSTATYTPPPEPAPEPAREPAPDAAAVTERDNYFFDLQGYLVLRGALRADEVAALNAGIDAIPPIKPGEWHGYVHGHCYGKTDGINYQQIYEAGEPFENLIDHPSWFPKVRHFIGSEINFDSHHGPAFIDENFASLRGPGEAIGIHSGGHYAAQRCQFRCINGRFHCGQINILMALTRIGPGDGGTMLIPGSHKSNFIHPDFAKYSMGDNRSVDGIEGAVEIFMEPGDALLFVDAISHGSAKRTNPGIRRIVVYRYGPSWGNFRHGYQPSPELLERLTPQRRQIVSSQKPALRPPGERA